MVWHEGLLMRRLPDYCVLIEQPTVDCLLVGAHEYLGGLYWTKFSVADVPEHLTSTEDFIGFVLHSIDRI